MFNTKKHNGRGIKVPAFFLLIAAVIISFFIYDDYGVAWDEPWQLETTQVNYDYIFKGDKTLLTHEENIYGMAIELPLLFIQEVFGIEDTRDIYFMRHLVSHLLWLTGVYVFILMIFRVFRKRWLALLAGIFLYLSPRIFAHSFFNTKDLPFLVFAIFSAYFFLLTYRKAWPNIIWLGIVSGFLVNIRLMGLLLVATAFFLLVLKSISTKEYRSAIVIPPLYLGITFLILWVSWPFLWVSPFANLAEAFRIMAKYPWNDLVLYFGEQIPATELPWHYIPGWILISTPILYLLFAIPGAVIIIVRVLRDFHSLLSNTRRIFDLFHLTVLVASLLAVIILSSTLYDDYRQLYYIYPSFLYLAVTGIDLVHDKLGRRWHLAAFSAIIAAGLLSPALFMIKNHPHQQVYFNEFISRDEGHIRKNFEMDYWGVSYRQAFEHILENDQRDTIRVMVANKPGIYNIDILEPEGRARLDVRFHHTEPHYFISNYRFHPGDYPYGTPAYSIEVLGSPVMSVWEVE